MVPSKMHHSLIPSMLCGIVLLLSVVSASAQPMVVAYVPNWIDLKAFATTIDYAKLTHINVAFENPVNAEGVMSFNKANAEMITQAHAHGVKVLVSIGGGSASEDKKMRTRYANLLSEANRAEFIAKLADYVMQHDFDGLDVDLEGPAITRDYGTFIHDLAGPLKAKGKLLTAALSKGYGGDQVPDAVFAHFDFINLMAYDDTGPWEPKAPGQHSSLVLAQETVAYWLKRGLPKSKAVLGVPLYGYGFGKDFREDEFAYAEIIAAHPGAEQTDQTGSTIYYNGIPTIRAKCEHVIKQGLAGIMIWSLNSDAQGGHSLLSTIHAALR